MPELKAFKVTTMPGTPVADALYFVLNGSYAETYVTNSTGVAKMVGNSVMIDTLIAAQISGIGATTIVADIAARDALTPDANVIVQVIDATDDGSVASGGATYLYDFANTTWIKISEFESLDLVLAWANITGKPSSSVSDIDDAVSKKHTHSNMTQLNKLSDDGSNVAMYNGEYIKNWNTVNW